MTPTSPWIQTASGCAIDLLSPSPSAIRLWDIAEHLSRQVRFNGAAGDWSVAAHSLLVAELLKEESPLIQLRALLHDAHEFAIGDICSPVKTALQLLGSGNPLAHLENRVQIAIEVAAGIGSSSAGQWLIKQADLIALAIEARDLLGPSSRAWEIELPSLEDCKIQLKQKKFRHWRDQETMMVLFFEEGKRLGIEAGLGMSGEWLWTP